jgi:hypothetical protein
MLEIWKDVALSMSDPTNNPVCKDYYAIKVSQSLSLSSSNSINTFDFFFLYTSPYSTVEKYRFKGLVDFSLHEKENG